MLRPLFPLALLLAHCGLARADVVIDHQPITNGGFASDTAWTDDLGRQIWQQAADDLSLATAATITHIRWWGFYRLDNPPAAETFRVRFYDARPDGLPGSVLFEQSFVNPTRVATGRIVFVSVDPREYRFDVDLPTAFSASAVTDYWLEVVQVGDFRTSFQWSYSVGGNHGAVLLNPFVPDWHISTLGADAAFQLWTVPEPGTCELIAAGFGLLLSRVEGSRTRWRKR